MNDTSKTKGSFEGWNEIWYDQSDKELLNPMYTEFSPNTIYQFWQQGYANDLLNLIEKKKYSKFCELGSGRGTTSMYLAKSGYTDLTMVDLARNGFEVAKFSFEKYDLPVPKMILENVEETNLKEESFDCIYNIGLLEHFDDPGPTLKEAYRLLNKGGLIYMPIVPKLPFYKSFFQRLLFSPISILRLGIRSVKSVKKKESKINRTDHSMSFYKNICHDIGFKNIICIPYNPYWKVNGDGKVENKFTLPIYKWHYNTFKKDKKLSLKTTNLFNLCFLLVAYKE